MGNLEGAAAASNGWVVDWSWSTLAPSACRATVAVCCLSCCLSTLLGGRREREGCCESLRVFARWRVARALPDVASVSTSLVLAPTSLLSASCGF